MFEVLKRNEEQLVGLHKQQAKIGGISNELQKAQEKMREAKLKETIRLSDLKDIEKLGAPDLTVEEDIHEELEREVTQPIPG
jgi:hypothetical protein